MRKTWSASALIVGIIASLVIVACAPKAKDQDDCGYVQNVYGERISWKGQVPVQLSIHESVPDQYVGAIKSAVETWNSAAHKTVFIVAEDKVSGEPVARDRKNVISISSTWEADSMSEQAKTAVNWVGDQIQEADIRINGSKTASGSSVFSFYWGTSQPNSINIEALVLHELGHVLGLKHKDKDSSVMATYLANNADRTALAGTDTKSLECEY